MRTPALAAAAAVLVVGLAACNGTATTPETTTSPTPGAASPTPGAESPTPGATASPTYATTATATATAGARGDQATANAAGQTFVRALGTGDAESACAVVATGARPVASDRAELARCTSFIGGLMNLVKEQVPELRDATVSGADVSGDTATFANATITPDLARSLLEGRTAVRIEDQWYITL